MLEEEFLDRQRQKKKRLVLLALLLMLGILGTIPLIEPPSPSSSAVAEAPTATSLPPPATPTRLPPTPTVIPDLPTATPMVAGTNSPAAESTVPVGVATSALSSVTPTMESGDSIRSDGELDGVDGAAPATTQDQPDEFTSDTATAATNESPGAIGNETSPALDQADEPGPDTSATKDIAATVDSRTSTPPASSEESHPTLSGTAGIDQEASGMPNEIDQNASELSGTEQADEEISSFDTAEADILIPEAEGSSVDAGVDSSTMPETSSTVPPDSKGDEMSAESPPPGGLPTTGDLTTTEVATHWNIIGMAAGMVLLLLVMGGIAVYDKKPE